MLASPAEDAAEIITRLGPEVWVEDKYDGIRAQLHKRGADVRLYSRDLHDISSGLPGDRRGGQPARLGRHPRRRDPRLAGRDGAAVHRAPGAARPQVAVGGDPGRGAGHLRRLRCARGRRRRRRAGRGAPAGAADRAPGPPRRAGPAARRGRRPVHPLAPERRGGRRRARGGVRRFACAAQRGAHGQGPGQQLLAGPARPRLAEDEEGARHDRLRRRRRRGRPRQAPRRPVRLHVRRARHRAPTSWSTSARRTAA